MFWWGEGEGVCGCDLGAEEGAGGSVCCVQFLVPMGKQGTVAWVCNPRAKKAENGDKLASFLVQ